MRTSLRITLGALLVLAVALAVLLARAPTPGGAAPVERNGAGRAGSSTDGLPELAAPGARVPAARGTASRAPEDPVRAGWPGRVVDVADGRGLEGFWAELVAPGEELPRAEARSGPDGHFVLEAGPVPGGAVRVAPEYGWRFDLDELPLGAAPLVFRARRAANAPFRTRLFDEETGEPLPHYLLGVRGLSDDARGEFLSDAEGLCSSAFDFEEGELELEGIDDGRLARVGRRGRRLPRVQHSGAADAPPVRVELSAGPTYRLDLSLPPELEPEMLHALLATDEAGAFRAHSGFARAPVRVDPDGGAPWVRFGPFTPPIVRRATTDGLVLVVADEALVQLGFARVRPRLGVYPEIVSVVLRPMGALVIFLADEEGQPVAGARVSISGAGRARALAARAATQEGRVAFEGLAPGGYDVRVSHRRFDDHRTSVRLAAGVTTERELVLGRSLTAGVVAGRVLVGARASAAPWRAPKEVVLASSEGRSVARDFREPLVFEELEDGTRAAEFRFEDVPAGAYTCRLWAVEAGRWWPRAIDLRPPRTDLEFVAVAPHELARLRLDVRDAQTSEVIEDTLTAVRQGGGGEQAWSIGSWGGALVHAQAELEWGVGAVGFVPQFGTRDDLHLQADVLSARVELERGFGVRLEVRGTEREPLVGARVSADGAFLGATDAHGRLFLRAEATPEVLRIEHAGLVLEVSAQTWEGRTLARGVPDLLVRLGPP